MNDSTNPSLKLRILEPNNYFFLDCNKYIMEGILNNNITTFYIIDSTKKYISLSTSYHLSNNKNIDSNENTLSISNYFEYLRSKSGTTKWFDNILSEENFNKVLNDKFTNSTYDINTNIFIFANDKVYEDNKTLNFFHFFVDSLPRLYYYFTHPKKETIKIFADINSYPQWYKSLMFDVFKLKEENFIYTDKPFVNSKLTYVCDINDFRYYDSCGDSFELNFIIEKILKTIENLSIKKEIPKLISLRKKGDKIITYNREFINRKEVVSLLEKYDFIDYDATSNFVEKVNIFMKAKIVVVENGSGIANLLFCPAETIVIILQSEHRVKVRDESLNISGYSKFNNICKKFKNLYVVSTSNKNNDILPHPEFGRSALPCRANLEKLEKILSIIF